MICQDFRFKLVYPGFTHSSITLLFEGPFTNCLLLTVESISERNIKFVEGIGGTQNQCNKRLSHFL